MDVSIARPMGGQAELVEAFTSIVAILRQAQDDNYNSG